MSNIQAAIGCAQMKRIDELIRRKREIYLFYREHLELLEGVEINHEPDGVVIGAWMPTVVFSSDTGVTREHLLRNFTADNIDARVFFYPLSRLSMFEDQKENRIAWSIPERAINLPSFHDITQVEQDRVCKIIYICLVSATGVKI